jgi:hypothetical protein
MCIFIHHDQRLCETVRLQRFLQQPFFRWRHVIWVVGVGRYLLLFDPNHAVNGLIVKWADAVQRLAKMIDRFYTRLEIKRFKPGGHIIN